MAYAPPPTRWQADESGNAWSQDATVPRSSGQAKPGPPQAAEVETVNDAWKHVKAVMTNDGKAADLYDLLANSGKDTIDPMPSGWPALLRPRSPMMGKMPAMVLQRYNACQTVCFCGVFPEIRRAWASVDNSLFLWRFDKWNDVPLEYSNEEQAICAVALVKPRPEVFAAAIQQLLVVCTTTEIVLLGVCWSAGNSGDPLNELSVVPLPGYSISSDNVAMCSSACTPEGRIFLGGGDGHLYEVLYNTGSGWRQKQCTKVDHSSGFSAYLPSFLPALWQKPSPILEIALDSHRHILYTRSQRSSIEVFDLGALGKDIAKRVAEMNDLLSSTAYAIGGDIFRGRSPADRKGATIVHLGIVPPGESSKLHLVVVTLDGRRVYMTTTPSQGYGVAVSNARPFGLKALVARQAPPQPAASNYRSVAGSPTGLTVGLAYYSHSMLLLSEMGQEGRSKLLVAARDMTIPPVGVSGGSNSLREAVGELEMLVPGETCSIQSIAIEQPLLPLSQNTPTDDLATQVTSQPPRFVLVSTAGVLELEKRRPVDILQQMLEERSSSKMEQFFKGYGAAEVAAMCFSLITSTPSGASANVVQQAKSALENINLTGVPQMRQDASADNQAPNTGFDMGQAVPVAEPEWSGSHKGLCMYVARLLQPVWEEALMRPVQGTAPSSLSCRIPQNTLEAFEVRLHSLEGFLKDYQQRRRASTRGNRSAAPSLYGDPAASGATFADQAGASGPANSGMPPSKRPRLEEAAKLEDQRVAWVRALVTRAAEGCFLLGMLSRHHMPRLTSRLDDNTRARLEPLKLRDLVCSSEGEAVAAQLISVLVTEHLTATGGVAEDLAASLQSGCPSFFKEDDKTFYQASGLLQRAEATASVSERDALVNQAVQLMMKVPSACDLGRVVPQLAYLRNFAGCVELPLRKASILDPNDMAAIPGPEGRAGREMRYEACYVHVMQVLKFLINPGTVEGEAASVEREARMSIADRSVARKVLLQRARLAEDPYFHEALYNMLIDLRATNELLDLDTNHLERHLRSNGGLPSGIVDGPIGPLAPGQVHHLQLLAKLYIRRQRFDLAAQIWEVLAVRRNGVGDQAISLIQRQEAYQNAVIEAKVHGDAQSIKEVEFRSRVVELQHHLAERLQSQVSSLEPGSSDRAALQDTLAELKEEPKELASLYNDYASPSRQWSIALEMVALANYNDPVYIRQLWDVYLRQAWDSKRNDQSAADSRAAASFEECCACVEQLGMQLYPNDVVFPEPHVCLRLELAAAGKWPESGPASEDDTRVASAMLKACNLQSNAVLRVYNTLLTARGAEDGTKQAHLPVVRLRLLRSQLTVLAPVVSVMLEQQMGSSFGSLYGGARREAGALCEACQRYATEAERLQPAVEAEELVREFNRLSATLEKQLSLR